MANSYQLEIDKLTSVLGTTQAQLEKYMALT